MRRRLRGFTDLGRIRIPPLPIPIVMADRADGKLWMLSHNTTESSTDGQGYISINDVIVAGDVHNYGPYEGPYVQERTNPQGNPVLRMLIRGGYLGFEFVEQRPQVQSIDNQRLLTRRSDVDTMREIMVPVTWQTNTEDVTGWQMLSWDVVTI